MDTILTRWRSPELLQKEIERLEAELGEARETPESDFLGLLESNTLIALGALGIIGSGQAAAWLLQRAKEIGTIQGPDFVQGFAQGAQAGLRHIAPWGPAAAACLGWLLLLGLTVFHLLFLFQKPREAGAKAPHLWLGWAVALSLVALPYYDFAGKRPAVSLLLGVALSAGFFALASLLPRNDALRRFLAGLGHGGVGAALAAILLSLVVAGFLFPIPTAALSGIFVISGLSFQVLLLGLNRRAKARSIAEALFRLEALRDELDRVERRRWVEEQLKRFRESPPPP